MQAYAGRCCILGEAVDGVLVEVGRRVKEIDRLRVRAGGTVLEAGDKGRDTDARADPDLTWLRIVEVETANCMFTFGLQPPVFASSAAPVASRHAVQATA